MGELERERQARRLSISPSHIRALVAAGGLLLIIGFLIGLQVGRGQRVSVEPAQVDPVREAELLEVLARVEAQGDASGGLGALTYPQALPALVAEASELPEGGTPDGTALVEPPGEAAGGLAAPPAPGPIVVLDTLSPEDAAQVLEGLESAGWSSWAEERRVDGEARVRVGVGPFADTAQAEQALASFVDLFTDAAVDGEEAALEPASPPEEDAVPEERAAEAEGEDLPAEQSAAEAEIEAGD